MATSKILCNAQLAGRITLRFNNNIVGPVLWDSFTSSARLSSYGQIYAPSLSNRKRLRRLTCAHLVSEKSVHQWGRPRSPTNILQFSLQILPTYLPTYLYIYLWLYSPLLDLGRFFSFLIQFTVGKTLWTGNQPVARPLPTQDNTNTE
jgi:hypothetical protein